MAKAKEALISAFLHLIENEEYEKISVTSLVAECGISRQTFYYHFEDIKGMLEWAFESETKKICDAQDINNWRNSAEMFVSLLEKYDTLLRKGIRSSDFIFLYNLIYNSFYSYIRDFIKKRQSSNPINDETEFLITCSAGSYCTLVLQALQKEKSDYNEILNKIAAGFKSKQ